MRLGLSMSDIVSLTVTLCSPEKFRAYRADGTAQSIQYIDMVRSYVSHELVTLFPEFLSDRRELDKLTFSMIDAIDIARNLLNEYATLLIGFHDPSMRFDRFVGPNNDLAISYDTSSLPKNVYASLSPIRNTTPASQYIQQASGKIRSGV
jgi:hypothetical protein